ncbi:hypothetical protein RQP46_002878 [Phenoliferia psychrophenolica]
MKRHTKKLYLSLVALRLLVALTSQSTIHPDEQFQNPEVAAALAFNYDSKGASPLLTWEWKGEKPCRSIVPVWITTGWAFELAGRATDGTPSGYTLFLIQRLVMFTSSLFIDALLYTTSHSPLPLLLYASSPLTLTFLLRPFSNSIESLFLAATLLLLNRIANHVTTSRMVALGALIAVGMFTRVTFLAWISKIILRGLPAVLSLLSTSLLLASLDSLHFSQGQSFILTPLNSLLFNVQTSNLAEHGLHPRWMHAVVNWPMLFGVGGVGVGGVAWRLVTGREMEVKDDKEVLGVTMERVYLACLLIPTILLSLLPHQEPRFLLPLLIPLVLLLPSLPFFKTNSTPSRSLRRRFWILWTIHSVIFTTLFGYLHQGGLVPTLLQLNSHLRSPSLLFPSHATPPPSISLIFWKTFMPPRHLLIPPLSPSSLQPPPPTLHLQDLSGAPPSTLFSTIQKTTSPTLVVAPARHPATTRNTEWDSTRISDLPLEILTKILKLAHDNRDAYSPHATSLVSRTWRHPAQRALFEAVGLPYPTPSVPGTVSDKWIPIWESYAANRLYTPRFVEIRGGATSRGALRHVNFASGAQELRWISGVRHLRLDWVSGRATFLEDKNLKDLERLDVTEFCQFHDSDLTGQSSGILP